MPRVVKHPAIRRAELLDRAAGLFLRHGYDNVSLNDLIADAGVGGLGRAQRSRGFRQRRGCSRRLRG